MGVDVLMRENEAVGVNVLTKVYCSEEASDVLWIKLVTGNHACFILVILSCRYRLNEKHSSRLIYIYIYI